MAGKSGVMHLGYRGSCLSSQAPPSNDIESKKKRLPTARSGKGLEPSTLGLIGLGLERRFPPAAVKVCDANCQLK